MQVIGKFESLYYLSLINKTDKARATSFKYTIIN